MGLELDSDGEKRHEEDTDDTKDSLWREMS